MFAHIFSERRGRYLSGDGFLRRARGRSSSLLRDLEAFWCMEEDGTVRYDATGNHELSVHGNPGRAAGKVGYAAQFVPATGDYLYRSGGQNLRLRGTDFTIAGWVYFNSVWETGLVSKWETGSLEYLVGTDEGGRFCFAVSGDGESSQSVSAAQEVETGAWYHFAAWYDTVGGTLNLAVNNGSPSTLNYNSGVFDGTTELNLGRNQLASGYLTGRLDAVGIWRRCLNAVERGRLWNGGMGVEWPF